jgi:superfamily II DNA/RNA helicase
VRDVLTALSLSLSTEQECVKFGQSIGIKSTCCYGGAPKGGQLRDIRNGVQVIVTTATPHGSLKALYGITDTPNGSLTALRVIVATTTSALWRLSDGSLTAL